MQCVQCSVGQYQDKSGQSYCEDCTAGYYGPVAAASSCIKCDAGFFNNQEVCFASQFNLMITNNAGLSFGF